MEIETHLGLELLGEVHGETITHSPTELIVETYRSYVPEHDILLPPSLWPRQSRNQ